MTDYTKLIERLVQIQVNVQDWKTIGEVKDAIEALQAECGSVTSANMGLQAENERLARSWEAMQAAKAGAEASEKELFERVQVLQSQLDAMGKGELVAYLFTDVQSGDIEVSLYEDEKPRSQWHRAALYAAPKALAPEQVEAAWRAGWAACRDAEFVGEEAQDEAWGMSETCSNADWDSAASKALAPEPLTDEQKDAARWQWLSQHIQVAWDEGKFTSLVRIVSNKNKQDLNASIDRMMAGDWSDSEAAHGIGGTP